MAGIRSDAEGCAVSRIKELQKQVHRVLDRMED